MTAPLDAQDLLAQLLEEAAAVHDLLSLPGLAGLGLLLASGWLAWWATRRAIRWAWARGLDPRLMPAAGALGKASIVGIWAGLTARLLLVRAPVFSTVLVGVAAGGFLLAAAAQLQRALPGVALVLRGRLKPGDRVSVGGVVGEVEHAGLWRVHLRQADGAAVELPIAVLATEVVAVSSPRRAQPVSVPVPPAWALAPLRLRHAAALCPYRAPGTAVDLQPGVGGPVLVIQAWSSAAVEDAERWLRAMLEQPLPAGSTTPVQTPG